MNIVNIIYMIEKSNLSDDEKASCIEVIRELERKLREETLRSNLLVNASEKANGKRRTAKMLKYATAMEQEATKPVKIKFKKFDLTEMKNPLINSKHPFRLNTYNKQPKRKVYIVPIHTHCT